MTKDAVTVVGADNLRRTAVAATKRISDMSATQRRVGDLVRGHASPPVVSGRLRGSLVVASATGESVTVSSSLPYAGRIEYTSRAFLMPAGRATEATWTGLYEDTIQDALDDVKGA